jgi:hypothetical protein
VELAAHPVEGLAIARVEVGELRQGSSGRGRVPVY